MGCLCNVAHVGADHASALLYPNESKILALGLQLKSLHGSNLEFCHSLLTDLGNSDRASS